MVDVSEMPNIKAQISNQNHQCPVSILQILVDTGVVENSNRTLLNQNGNSTGGFHI
jgi:hypothetical protein